MKFLKYNGTFINMDHIVLIQAEIVDGKAVAMIHLHDGNLFNVGIYESLDEAEVAIGSIFPRETVIQSSGLK